MTAAMIAAVAGMPRWAVSAEAGAEPDALPAAEEPATPVATPAVEAPKPAEVAKPAEAPKPAEVAKPAEAPKPAADARHGEGESKAEPVGASTCLGCHAAREDFRGNVHAKVWPKVKGIDFEHSCEACHGNGSEHAGAAGDKANPGYATVKRASEGSEACMTCHKGRGRMHWEGSVHETRGVGCTGCHSVHSGHGAKNLRTADPKDVCLGCHQNLKGELRRQSHHPILEGRITCGDCHNPHGSAGRKLLVGDSLNQTCFKCHADKRGPFLWEHRPVSEDCTVCHLTHGSVHDKLLRQKSPILCQSCHSGSRHPGTPNAVNPNTPGDSTYERLRVQVYYRGCLNCHPTIHGSNHPAGNFYLR
ncbi:MAG: DmsE family decaheme c-type cytochrome [Candidatus Coatesbacteria bacterium]